MTNQVKGGKLYIQQSPILLKNIHVRSPKYAKILRMVLWQVLNIFCAFPIFY